MACKDWYLYYSTDYCPNGVVYCPCVSLTVLMPETSRTRVVSSMNIARCLAFCPPCTILADCMCSWYGVRVVCVWQPCGDRVVTMIPGMIRAEVLPECHGIT